MFKAVWSHGGWLLEMWLPYTVTIIDKFPCTHTEEDCPTSLLHCLLIYFTSHILLSSATRKACYKKETGLSFAVYTRIGI